jgi:hypothetical protein
MANFCFCVRVLPLFLSNVLLTLIHILNERQVILCVHQFYKLKEPNSKKK